MRQKKIAVAGRVSRRAFWRPQSGASRDCIATVAFGEAAEAACWLRDALDCQLQQPADRRPCWLPCICCLLHGRGRRFADEEPRLQWLACGRWICDSAG